MQMSAQIEAVSAKAFELRTRRRREGVTRRRKAQMRCRKSRRKRRLPWPPWPRGTRPFGLTACLTLGVSFFGYSQNGIGFRLGFL